MLGKILGGVLGFVVSGPIGALLGVGIGSLFDKGNKEQYKYNYRGKEYVTSPGDFAVSLLVLTAAVMKADNRILKSELDFVKAWYKKQFGVEQTKEYMLELKDLLKKDIPLRDVCTQIRNNMSVPNRLHLIHYLCELCAVDNNVDENELRILHTISHYLGINSSDLESIKAMVFARFYQQNQYQYQQQARPKQQGPTQWDYKILEVEPNATDAEIKKSYRKLAFKYHPDKVSNLGPEHQEAAKEKFQKLTAAYDRICEARGMK